MFDDPQDRLSWLEEELLDEEFEEDEEFDEEEEYDDGDLRPGYNYAVDFSRTAYADEESEEDMVYMEPPKRRGTRGLRFLAFLEILGILAVIGWWLKWLI